MKLSIKNIKSWFRQIRYPLLLTLISISIIYFNYPEGPFPVLAIFALIPWGFSLKKINAPNGLLIGFIFGFLYFLSQGWSLTIVCNIILNFGSLKSWLFIMLLCAVHAIPYTIFGFIYGIFNKFSLPTGPLRSALLLTILQIWLMGVFPGTPAHMLYSYPIFLQILDIGGPPLLLFAFNLVNWLIIEIIYRIKEHKSPKSIIATCLCILILIVGYGKIRIDYFHEKAKLAAPEQIINIASIQPNIPVKHWGNSYFVEKEDANNDLSTVIKLTKEAYKTYPNLELIAWPELPLHLPCDKETKKQEMVRKVTKDIKSPLSIVCEQDISTKEQPKYYNTAIYIDKSGIYKEKYHKQVLVPFWEYLPYEKKLPFLRKIFKYTRYYQSDDKIKLFEISKDKRIIPSICYEIIFSEQIRKFAKIGGNIILNMSDDAWFGRSTISAIHLSLGIFRAIEYRMPFIRVTNSGNGCFVQPTGEIVENSLTPLFEKKISSFPLYIPNEQSIYLQTGNTFLWILTVIFLMDFVFLITIYLKNHLNFKK